MTALNKQALLIENGQLVADTLRHLANNEIDSDYFAITSTSENGTEIEHELVITDYALQAAGTVDELVEALEAEQGYREGAFVACNRWHEKFRESEAKLESAEKRIAELKKQCAEWERKALSNFEECAAMAERIEEMQTKSAPDSFGIIGENIRTQDNRITSDPMFCVYQKREIVVDADYDHDRIVWVDEDGNEANKRQSRRLELLHENFREPPEKWRRVAVKDIDEFVTCCFTEQGCKDYLAANGHNLRLPFIHVKSGFRNAEYIGIRNWLAGIRIKGGE